MSGDFRKYLNVYEFEVTLPGSKEVVKFKPLTTGQLKKVLMYEDTSDPVLVEQALDELITSAVTSDGFDIGNLYLQDRFFLLVEIRRRTKGDIYNFRYNCPECNSQSLGSVNLGKLEVKELNIENNIVKLNENLSVTLRPIKRSYEIEADKILSKKERDEDLKLSPTQRLAEVATMTQAMAVEKIISPEGETEPTIEDSVFLLDNVEEEGFEAISDWFEKNDFGIDFRYPVLCMKKECNHKDWINIPVQNFFF